MCQPSKLPDRELLWDYLDPAQRDGWYSAVILGTIGGATIGYTFLHLGIIHQGITANITLETQVRILTAGFVLGSIYEASIYRLHSKSYIGHGEAYVLNAFITVGNSLLPSLQAAAAGVCAAKDSISVGMQQLSQQVKQLPQIFQQQSPQAQAMGQRGPSSLNLVGQMLPDLESGGSCGPNTASSYRSSGSDLGASQSNRLPNGIAP